MSAVSRKGRHSMGSPYTSDRLPKVTAAPPVPPSVPARRVRPRRPVRSRIPGGRVSLWGCVKAEFIKLRALRSTWWLMGLTVILLPAGAALAVWANGFIASVDDQGKLLDSPQSVDAADLWTSVSGFMSTVAIVIGVFGVLAITSEYAARSIQSTFLASPNRLRVLAAKAIVVGVMSFVASFIGLLLGWLVASGMSGEWPVVPLEGYEWRLPWVTLFGGALVGMLMALMSLGLGSLCRSTPVAVFVLIGIFMILPSVLAVVSVLGRQYEWLGAVASCLPGSSIDGFLHAGVESATYTSSPSQGHWEPNWWQSLLVIAGWAVAFDASGVAAVTRLDVR